MSFTDADLFSGMDGTVAPRRRKSTKRSATGVAKTPAKDAALFAAPRRTGAAKRRSALQVAPLKEMFPRRGPFGWNSQEEEEVMVDMELGLQAYNDCDYYDSPLQPQETIVVSELLTHIFLFLPPSVKVLRSVSSVSHGWRDRSEFLPQWFILQKRLPSGSAFDAKNPGGRSFLDRVPPLIRVKMEYPELEAAAQDAHANTRQPDSDVHQSSRASFQSTLQKPLVNAWLAYRDLKSDANRTAVRLVSRIFFTDVLLFALQCPCVL